MHELLDEQHARALRVDLAQDAEQLLDDLGGEAEGELVDDEQARVRHQRPSDAEHLLLAARERAGGLTGALAQDGEVVHDHVDLGLEAPVAAAGPVAEAEVVDHGQVGEQLTALWHVGDAAVDHLPCRQAADALAVEADLAARRGEQAGDGAQGGGLAGAVRADQRHHLRGRDLQCHAPQRLDRSVVDVDVVDLEHQERPLPLTVSTAVSSSSGATTCTAPVASASGSAAPGSCSSASSLPAAWPR